MKVQTEIVVSAYLYILQFNLFYIFTYIIYISSHENVKLLKAGRIAHKRKRRKRPSKKFHLSFIFYNKTIMSVHFKNPHGISIYFSHIFFSYSHIHIQYKSIIKSSHNIIIIHSYKLN